MALVVLLKGVNVGGYRTFRPTVLTRELKRFGVVNIGAAGSFVVSKPVTQAELRAELMRRLPFQTDIMICNGTDILRLTSGNPFVGQPSGPDIIQFVSVLAKRRQPSSPVPMDLPPDSEWCLRIVSCQNRFVLGLYRREMKAIRYLGQLERIFGVSLTTRNWNTMLQIARILKT